MADDDLTTLAREAAQGDLAAARRLVEVLERDASPQPKPRRGACRKCGSTRMARVDVEQPGSGGRLYASVAGREGWCSPRAVGLSRLEGSGGGDRWCAAWCLDCGTARGKFPLKTVTLETLPAGSDLATFHGRPAIIHNPSSRARRQSRKAMAPNPVMFGGHPRRESLYDEMNNWAVDDPRRRRRNP